MTRFTFYNDTERTVSIHPGTTAQCYNDAPIQPNQTRTFTLPDGANVYAKLWDYGEPYGLQIYVCAD